MRRSVHRDEAGFSLVEVLVATSILLVGLLGTVSMLDMANAVTTTTKAREQAVSLQREIVEDVRAIPYADLTPSTVGPAVRGNPALADSTPGTTRWTVHRRGVTYTAAVGVCAVDDPSDGTGLRDGSLFCATGAGTTSAQECAALLGTDGHIQGVPAAAGAGAKVGDCGIDLSLDGTVDNLTEASVGLCAGACEGDGGDAHPSDYKRVVVLVRWDQGAGSRYALQATTVAYPGRSTAPTVSALQTGASDPVTSGTEVPLSATTSAPAATVSWYVDGTMKGSASGAGSDWSFNWMLGSVSAGTEPGADEVLDGTYLLGARAFDAYGQFGSTRELTITVNRRAPYAVKEFAAGRNGSVVELEWRANPERDIEGYRVYRHEADGSPALVCSLVSAMSCQDVDPPPSGSPGYFAVAVDRTAAGSPREGERSADATVSSTNTRPTAPTGLTATTSGGDTVLQWSAASDPDADDSVAYYRIYRNGIAFTDRYDRTGTGAELVYTDTRTGGATNTYWVVAVDEHLAESVVAGPVSG